MSVVCVRWQWFCDAVSSCFKLKTFPVVITDTDTDESPSGHHNANQTLFLLTDSRLVVVLKDKMRKFLLCIFVASQVSRRRHL